MKAVITGASGFVGSNLIPYLTARGILCTSHNLRNSGHLVLKNQNVIIHLAGKAHDQRKVNNPDEYYIINTELTKKVFDQFLFSEAKIFITLSSVKAVADSIDGILLETSFPNPQTHYGKSKLEAEQYILSQPLPEGKRFFILRPCMIYGPRNKGNLNLLFKVVQNRIPWILGAYENKRSFLSVENLCFVIAELLKREDIPSGVYNLADDDPISTNELISLIGEVFGRRPQILMVPKLVIRFISNVGDLLHFPLNSDRLRKLTENYIVSNKKCLDVLKKPLPLSSREGLKKTFNTFMKFPS